MAGTVARHGVGQLVRMTTQDRGHLDGMAALLVGCQEAAHRGDLKQLAQGLTDLSRHAANLARLARLRLEQEVR